MSPSAYISAGSVDGTTNTISSMSAMPDFKRRFPFMETYTIEMVLPGQSGSVQLVEDGAPFLLWGAERKPSFFDAEVITPTALTCYNSRQTVPGLEHSGDLNSAAHFMHSVRCKTFTENVYSAAAVAYNSNMNSSRLNKLVDYEAVSPFILLVDHLREVMYAVPFSLERATIGDSMMIAPLIFHMSRGGLVRWYVPATCPTDGRVATGQFTNSFKEKMRALATTFERDFAQHSSDAPQLETSSTSARVQSAVSRAIQTAKLETPRQVVFVQDGLSILPQPDRVYVNFGSTLDISLEFAAKSEVSMILPIVSGEAHGHAALGLGKRATTSIAIDSGPGWRGFVNLCPSVVIYADNSSAWYEGVMQAQTHRLVGLMIVRISSSLSTDAKTRAREMSDLKLCCVRMMAGASIIVLQPPTGTAYFYRGATSVLPISPADPCFGDPIDLEATLSLHSARRTPLSIGSFVTQSFNMIVGIDGATIPAVASRFVDLVMQGGVEWKNAACQLSVCLSTAEVDSFKSDLTKRILAVEENETKDARDHLATLVTALKSAFKDAPADVDLTLHTATEREAIIAHKTVIRDIQTVYRDALGRVEEMCSLKIVSARKIGVQQAQRKMAVQQNVARASSLSASQLANKLMDSTWGFAVAAVNADAASDMLRAISTNGMDKYLQDLAVGPMRVITSDTPLLDVSGAMVKRRSPFVVAPNCTMLDPESVQIMLEHTQEQHILTSTGKQLTFCLQGIPHLILPLFDVELNGDYVDFMNKANDEAAADFRVTLRGMLSNLKARFPIKPSSPDLTFGIQMIVLSLMHSITTTISNVATLDPACTVCQTLRGLFYLWGTFAGSGQKPVTFAYQLTQPGAKLALPRIRGEWTIYALIAHMYPYLRLPLDAFKSNVRTLLVRAIRRTLVAPLLEDANKKSAEQLDADRKLRAENRNIALRWNYAACAVLTRIDKKSLSRLDGVASASKLLQSVPTEPTYTTKQLTKTLTLVEQGQPVHWDLVRTFIACAVVKRSGVFAKPKKKMTVAALTRAKVNMCQQVNLKIPGDVVLVTKKEDAPSGFLFCGQTTVDGDEMFVFKDPDQKSDISVQNEGAYLKYDMAKMKGDAELTREAWRINGDEIRDGISNSDFLRKMLPSLVEKVSASAAKTLIVAKDMPPHCAGSTALAKLWETADTLHPSMLEKMMPATCMRTLFSAICVSELEQAKAIGDVVHILLRDPKHMDDNECQAVQHLKVTYDAPSTVQIE